MDLIKLYSQEKKYIGYWRSCKLNVFNTLPWPKPNNTQCQKEIITQAKSICETFGIKTAYFGYSHCRLCNKIDNGNEEYLISYKGITWVIPTGYFHYLETHNVRISNMLIEITNHYMTL